MKIFKKMEQLQIQVLLLLLLCTGIAMSMRTGRQGRDTPVCNMEDPELTGEVKRCTRKGERFINKYFKNLSKKKSHKPVCSLFKEAHQCFRTLFSKCSASRNLLSPDWLAVYDVIACQCDNQSEECIKAVTCFEDEHRQVLSVRCDNYFVFNQRQKTRHHCHFVHENIQCKQALVASACGNYAGDFAFYLYKYNERKSLRRPHHCGELQKDTPYSGFRYSEHCPRSYLDELYTCEDILLKNGVHQAFHVVNDLVFNQDGDAVHSACRDYKKYEACRAPIKDQCPHGVKILDDYDREIRTLRMKLHYICEERKDAYVQNLPCYKQVIENGTLKVCNDKYEALLPIMQDVVAHQFYCQRNSDGTQKLLKALGDLRVCYEETFVGVCGNEGGMVMIGLMTEAFQDPMYLRYSYEPDCSLHKPDEHDLLPELTTEGENLQVDEGHVTDTEASTERENPRTPRTHPPKTQTKRPRKTQEENEVITEPEAGHRRSSSSCVSPKVFHSLIMTLALISWTLQPT